MGVWVGNADNQPMENVSGITGAGPIWHEFMQTVLLGRPALDFPEPPGLARVPGLLRCRACRRILMRPALTRAPKSSSKAHSPRSLTRSIAAFRIDAATGQLANTTTPPGRVIEQTMLVLPIRSIRVGER